MLSFALRLFVIFAVTIAGMNGTVAKTTSPSAPREQSDPGQASPPNASGNGSPSDLGTGQSRRNGDLSHSQGVMLPPDTGDPAVKPPPNAGSANTPVIPPPGTPGGRQDIKPQ